MSKEPPAELLEDFHRITEGWVKRAHQTVDPANLERLILQVSTHLIERLYQKASTDHPFNRHLHRYVLQNLHKGPTLTEFAEELRYSVKYCSWLVRTHTGESFRSHVKRIRVEAAKRYLSDSHLPIAEIAFRLGFQDQFAFSRFFKHSLGESPRHYRQKTWKEPDIRSSPSG